ncbi:hypothetical protein H0H81_006802 [Sphagnurus paluster]|uniref:F-box domain-containing protein n=1 Tax=Sphagnurus paluster TaxID=117069 RepID=A0A9P7GKW5_9AGAR|nr:hypothetical protein H0H81_006802 [Sphagnurus paluster]
MHETVVANLSLNPRSSSGKQMQNESHRQQHLPCLPPELWILILRYATCSACTNHDEYSPAVSFLSLSHSQIHLQHRLTYYRAAMRRKALMTLVCKAWYTYAQEILFEFVWISRASEARLLAAVLASTSSSSGKYIRRLHIETPSLERCDPADLRTILDCAPRLVVYSDYRSIRRSFHLDSAYSDPRASPKQLLSALAHPNNSLRRLSWTNYDDVSFHLHMSPMLETTAANLEFLELNFCSSHLHSMFPSAISSLSKCPIPDTPNISLTLPALRSLKVTLDNATFAVLSTWSMPALQNLSVVSADFSYASSGFSEFFLVHGPKLTQLELGHSSSSIEEHYLTAPAPNASGSTSPGIPLAAWCPNLVEFICSADAEWNWQHPDWIAPHVLLPTHPTLQLIGIRDIDKRLRDDFPSHHVDSEEPFFMLLQQIGSLLQRDAFPALRYIRDLSWESDLMRRGGGLGLGLGVGASTASVASRPPRFGLGRLFRRRVSDAAGGDAGLGMVPARAVVSAETRQVLRFWRCVLERCRDGGVWLEDLRGVNVTLSNLMRAEAGKGVATCGSGWEGW